MKLVTSLMNFQCQSCMIFEVLSYHQEDKVIDPIIVAATVGLRERINKFVSSKFMGMVISVSAIFDTGATYSCSSNKGDFLKLEDKTFPINLQGTAKGLEISGFGIVECSVRSEIGRMIALWDQACYVPGLPKDFRIISSQGIFTSEGYKGTFISHCRDYHDGYAEVILKDDKPGWQKSEPVERVYVKYDPNFNLPTDQATLTNQRDNKVKVFTSSVWLSSLVTQTELVNALTFSCLFLGRVAS